MEETLTKIQERKETDDAISGYVLSLDDLKELMLVFQSETTTAFKTVNSSKEFGSPMPSLAGHKVRWKSMKTSHLDIDYTGTPFIIHGSKRLECHNGPDRNVSHKRKLARGQRVKHSMESYFVEFCYRR